MSGNPQIDPRLLAARRFLDEYAAALSKVSPGPASHAARMLELLDAADGASGVRRITAQELADNLQLARAEERQRIADGLRMTRSLGDRPALLQHVDRIIELTAADSPVGGVS